MTTTPGPRPFSAPHAEASLADAAPVVGVLADDGLAAARTAAAIEKLGPKVRLSDRSEGTDDHDGHGASAEGDGGGDRRPHRGETSRGAGDAGQLVELHTGSLPLGEDGDLDLAGAGGRQRRENGWDRLIYVTDMPLTARRRPVVHQSDAAGEVTVVSLPALGCVRTTARLAAEISAALHGRAGADSDSAGRDGEGADDAVAHVRTLDKPGRDLRLLAGMIRCNRPASLLKALAGCLAAVAATGGFGIFYGSIWKMAHAISVWRLVLVAVVSVAVLTGWLIGHNGMWHRGGSVSAWRRRIDNLSTVGTVGLAVGLIYLAAVTGMLLLSVVVVPPGYLSEQIGSAAGPGTYLAIAWFAASLGTMGGALGSNFDRSVLVRSATYSKREYERRRRTGYYDDRADDRADEDAGGEHGGVAKRGRR